MSIENGWFLEKNGQWPGICTGLQVKEVLYHEKTKYQDLLVFDSVHWGRVMVLDGAIQLTERDECSYHEMIAHVPLFSHSHPQKVLIIGGGDGGALREVCKHSCVEEVLLVDIDEGVVNASKRYFPELAAAYLDPRVKLHICDAVKLVESYEPDSFDVIIVDSSDPAGPAEKLYSPKFYENAAKILRSGGIMATQGECFWIHGELMQELLQKNGKPFRSAEYASVQTPTYPCGQITLLVLSKGQNSCAKPVRIPSHDMELRYYSSTLHETSFVLPSFAQSLFIKCSRDSSS